MSPAMNRLLVFAAGFLVASILWIAVGLWAVCTERAETKRQRDSARENWELAEGHREKAEANLKLAQANLKLAKKAVDDCFMLATQEPLFQQESMREVRQLLLKKALPFYKGFRAQRPDDRFLQAEHADQLFRVAFITQEIGQKEDALHGYEEARAFYAKLAKAHPDVPEYQEKV
jgi:hypothetical protein